MDTMWRQDLPESFEPMVCKELRQNLRRHIFVGPFLGIQVLAVVALALEFHQGTASPAPEESLGLLNLWLLLSSGPLWLLAGGVCGLLMPAAGMLLMDQETDEGNHELLQMTGMRRWRIIRGKFLAVWGLSALTFVSLLPYTVTRYLVGGVQWRQELASGATVLALAALVTAGAIGASAFRNVAARAGVFVLFLVTTLLACLPPLLASAFINKGCGWFYHLTALCALFAYTMVGLALGRSRLRIHVSAYEIKPGGSLLALVVFSPFLTGMGTAITVGFGGFLVLLGVAAIAWRTDRSNARLPGWDPLVWQTPARPITRPQVDGSTAP